MVPELERIPFDHYQRYATAAGIIGSLKRGALRILEVGANRQRLLGSFLSQAEILYTDIELTGDDEGFVIADATALPFGNGQFDVVVCLDVLEHIPADLRAAATREMARVSSRLVVLGCPTDHAWVQHAEEVANGHWKQLFDEDYPWLSEHKQFGLVDGDATEHALAGSVAHVVRFAQGRPALWASLMGAHFFKERVPDLAPLVAAADYLYNTMIFPCDRPKNGYREFFVGLHLPGDEAAVRPWSESDESVDAAVLAFLEGLSASMRGIVDRVNRSEGEWASAIRLYREQSVDLELAKVEWSRTSGELAAAERGRADSARAMTIAAAGWEESVASLRVIESERDGLVQALTTATAGWEETVASLRVVESERDGLTQALTTATAGWKETVASLRVIESERDGLAQALTTATAGWEDAVAAGRATEADRNRIRQELDCSVQALATAMVRGEEAAVGLRASEAELRSTRHDLQVATREWGGTAELLVISQAERRRLEEQHARERDAHQRVVEALRRQKKWTVVVATLLLVALAAPSISHFL